MFKNGIAVIGLGYIGLPTSVAIASHGVSVTGVDVDEFTIAEINAGRTPVFSRTSIGR